MVVTVGKGCTVAKVSESCNLLLETFCFLLYDNSIFS